MNRCTLPGTLRQPAPRGAGVELCGSGAVALAGCVSPDVRVSPNLSVFSPAGLAGAARTQLPAGRRVPGHVPGADGGDPHLGAAQTQLPARLHGHLRHAGQHVPPLQAPDQALAVL